MAQMNLRERADAPGQIWVAILEDDGSLVDPTGLLTAVGFDATGSWNDFTAEVVDRRVLVTVPDSYRANLRNREFRLRVTIDGTVYGPWSVKVWAV